VSSDSRRDEGFTLLEAVVAMIIFGIIASSTAAVLVRAVGGSSDNRARTAAANVAAQAMDTIRANAESADGYTGLATQQLDDVTVQGRTYSVYSSVSVVTGTNSGSPCTSGGLTDELYKRVGVTVTWANAGSVKPVRSDTIIQNPGVAADPDKGALGVLVSGPSGPEARVPVRLDNGASAITDDGGCAYFSGLAPANYTATASALNFVDEDGNLTESQTAGVQKASATVVNLAYAAASTPTITYSTVLANGTTDPSYLWPGSTAYTLKNDSRDRSGTVTTNTTTPSLYPYASGYNSWLGSCTTEAPASIPNFATPEGSSPAVTISVGGLAVRNTQRSTLTVVLQHPDACGTSFTTTLAPNETKKLALPFGSWTASSYNGVVNSVLTGRPVNSVASPSPAVLTAASPVAAVTF
jgi:prepilin-type N-terminal cleavage/methylation domain-containing protein